MQFNIGNLFLSYRSCFYFFGNKIQKSNSDNSIQSVESTQSSFVEYGKFLDSTII